MVDMINFLKYHGAKIYNGKKIYLNSIPSEDFPIFISRGEYSKAYFDIKENKFCGLSWKYGQDLKAKAEEEKEQIEEWMKEQESKAKEESPATQSEPVQIPKIKADDETETIKGSRRLTSLLMLKLNFISKSEILKQVKEIIKHGVNQFYFKVDSAEIQEKIKTNAEYEKYLIESVVSFFIKRMEREKNISCFDDVLSFVYHSNFDEMTENVINFISGNNSKTTRSQAQKQADKKYNKSEKGKQASKKYRDSDKGRETIMNYRQSESGKQAKAKANKKYRDSDKGQEQQKQAYNKYMESDKGKQARRDAVRAYRERQKAKKQALEVINDNK